MIFGFKKKKPSLEKKEEDKIKKEEIKKEVSHKLSKKNSELISKILIKPLITEKATDLGVENKYIFEVNRNANKIEIKKVIEGLYNVKPLKINIIKNKGKKIRYGKTEGILKNTKKAIITLKEGDKIDIFEK